MSASKQTQKTMLLEIYAAINGFRPFSTIHDRMVNMPYEHKTHLGAMRETRKIEQSNFVVHLEEKQDMKFTIIDPDTKSIDWIEIINTSCELQVTFNVTEFDDSAELSCFGPATNIIAFRRKVEELGYEITRSKGFPR